MRLKESLLEYGAQQSTNGIPQSILKTPIGYTFNLNEYNSLSGSFNPSIRNGIADAAIGNSPFMLPVALNLAGNMFINVDYTTVGNWSGNLRIGIAPVSLQTTIFTSLGSKWAINQTFPNSTWAILGECYSQAIAAPSGGSLQFNANNLLPNGANQNQLALYGYFAFCAWIDNYANGAAGDSFVWSNVQLSMPFSNGLG
jgi:hypothetical protein